MLTLFKEKSESASIRELESEVQALRQELQAARVVIEELRAEIQAIKEEKDPLKAQLQEAQATIQALEAELEKYRKPPKDSTNSSIPPSQDKKRKPYPKREKSNHCAGAQPGHEGKHRSLVDNPDKWISLYPSACSYCGSGDLLEQPDRIGERRQEVDLPPVQPVTTEYRKCAALCRHCGKISWGEFPEEIKAPVQIGPQATAVIGLLKVNHHQSHEKIVLLFQDVLGLPISKGCINARLQGLAKRFENEYEAIRESLKKGWLLQSDETGNKIAQKKGYTWVFLAPLLCLFVSGFSRSFQVIKETIGETFGGSYVSDRYAAHLKVKCDHQVCLAHLLRDCQYAIDTEQSEWAKTAKNLLKETIAFHKEKGNDFDPLEVDTFRQIQVLKERLDQLLEKPPPNTEEKALFKGLLRRKKEILHFLDNLGVPPDNNAAERALRSHVVHRKVNGGFQSVAGAKAHDVLSSIIETAKLQDRNLLDVLAHKIQLSIS